MMTHAFNTSSTEAEAGESQSSRSVWSTKFQDREGKLCLKQQREQ